MKYKFSNTKDNERFKKEIEDNFAAYSTVQEKQQKFKTVFSQPQAKDYQEGDTVIYDDGTNIYKYYKSNGRLFRQTLTEV